MPLVAFFRDDTPFSPDWNRIRAAGAALSVNVCTVLNSHSATLLLRQQVYDLVSVGEPVALTMVDLGEVNDSCEAFGAICRLLRETLESAGALPRTLGVAVDASALAPGVAWRTRSDALGAGPLFVALAPEALAPSAWKDIWKLRMKPDVRFTYKAHAAPQTRLLPDEKSLGLIPDAGIQAPTGTAWITSRVDLASLINGSGHVDEARLVKCLVETVEQGDERHSSTRWPTAQMRHDAWLNRRQAIEITGLGELLRVRGLDPARFSALDELNELLRLVRETLFAATHRLARSAGIVPALDQADPGRLLPAGRIGDGWAWRWRQALESAAVRNRNLLALSPWSLFPPGPADFRYANLLPLLRHADVCLSGETRDTGHWTLRDFRSFHQQAAAALHQRGAPNQIAVHA